MVNDNENESHNENDKCTQRKKSIESKNNENNCKQRKISIESNNIAKNEIIENDRSTSEKASNWRQVYGTLTFFHEFTWQSFDIFFLKLLKIRDAIYRYIHSLRVSKKICLHFQKIRLHI